MNPLTGPILLQFESMPGSREERDYHNQVYRAIKLDLSKMEKYSQTSHFNHCKKCNMVLTVEDKALVYDWEEISSNPLEFKEFLEKYKEEDEKVIWICSFCEQKNLLDSFEVKFAKNNSRVIERPAESTTKKEPILLIVFDISGSMNEVLPNQQNSYSSLVDKIKKTKIYERIVADEQAEIQQLCEKQSIKLQGDKKMKYTDYLKKNKLLMGLTEYLVGEFNTNTTEKRERKNQYPSKSNTEKKDKVTKTIGFVFFHSNVIIKPSSQSEYKSGVIVCDTNGTFSTKAEGMTRERVNFDHFESLFKLGANYGLQYNTKINEFQFGDLDFNFTDYNSGQTALGPAIVVATGIMSQHGTGSSIVVVTDGIGNKGIFDQSQKWEQPLKLLKLRLQKHKCFLTMLEYRNVSDPVHDKPSTTTCMDQFCKNYEDLIARKINIQLHKNKTADHLINDAKNKMATSINRQNVIWTNQAFIRSQNPNVTFEEDMKKLTQKLHHGKETYLNPKIDYKKLKEKDYLHHFMTQAVIRYENTQTGEQSTFLTYALQKFIKSSLIRKQTIKKLDNEKTFHDILEYLSAQDENYDISNMSLSFVKKTFRDTLMFSKSICNRSMRFPGRSQEGKEEEVSYFEQIYNKVQETIREEEEGDGTVL